MGIGVTEMYWTLGQYDVAAIFDAPNDAAMTALAPSIGTQGNVRTQILPAFTEAEIGPIVAKAMKKK